MGTASSTALPPNPQIRPRASAIGKRTRPRKRDRCPRPEGAGTRRPAASPRAGSIPAFESASGSSLPCPDREFPLRLGRHAASLQKIAPRLPRRSGEKLPVGLGRQADDAVEVLPGACVRAAALVLDGHAAPAGELLDRVREGEVAGLHQEIDHRPPFAAAEALEGLPGGIDEERRGFFAVERAQPPKARPGAAQGHRLGYHLDDIRAVPDFTDRGFGDTASHGSP